MSLGNSRLVAAALMFIGVALTSSTLDARGGRGGSASASPGGASASTRGNGGGWNANWNGNGVSVGGPSRFGNAPSVSTRNGNFDSNPYPRNFAAPQQPMYRPAPAVASVARSAPPPPTYSPQRSSTPTPTPTARASSSPAAPTVAAPASFRATAADHLYSLAKAAAWNMYDNYTDSPTYAATYREMYKLLQGLQGIASQARSQPTSTGNAALATRLQDVETALTAIQAEVAAWPSSAGEGGRTPDLNAQLDRMSATLAALLVDVGLPRAPAPAIDDDAGETIRSRRAAAEPAVLAPAPIGIAETN